MEHTKGELHWEGKTKGFKDEDKDGFYRSVAAAWLSGSQKEPFLVPWDYEGYSCGLYISEANAKEFIRRWNAFEEGGLVEELLIGCNIGLSYINAVANKVPRPISDLSIDKELVEAALAKS